MRKTYGTMVFINVMWGLSFIFSKQGMNAGFQPMGLAFVRYVLAAAALIPLLLWREGAPRLRREDMLPMFLSSLAGITVYYFCEYNGIQRTSTVSASLILAAIPVLTLGAEALLTRARLRPMQAAGSFPVPGGGGADYPVLLPGGHGLPGGHPVYLRGQSGMGGLYFPQPPVAPAVFQPEHERLAGGHGRGDAAACRPGGWV